MTKRLLAQFSCIIVTAGMVLGQTLVLLSGAPPDGQPVLVLNPYKNIKWETTLHCKANMHTHTVASDGRLLPHVAIDEYHQRDYQILAITDHNKCLWPWTALSGYDAIYENRDPTALGMLAIPGNELSRHHHTQSFFTTFESTDSNQESVLQALAATSPNARALLNHPAWHWSRNHPAKGFQIPLTPPLRQLGQGDFTVEAWFRCADTNRNILFGNYAADYKGAINLELHTDNRLRLYIQPRSGSPTDLNLSGGSINTRDGQWHHAAGVRRAGNVYLYLDGTQLGNAVNDKAGNFDLFGDLFWLGRDVRGGSTEFTGGLDQIRLWRRALEATEVAMLFAGAAPGNSVPRTNLLAEYNFDRAQQLADVAGHPQGPFNATLAEPGYRIAPAPAQQQLAQGDFTLCAWFRTTDVGRNIIFGNYTNPSLAALNLELHDKNRLRLYLQPLNGTTTSFLATPEIDTRDGQWHHFAGIRAGSTLSLYLNGKKIAQTNDQSGPFQLPDNPFFIGRDARIDATVFKGDLDNLQLWQRALSEAELTDMANNIDATLPENSAALLACYSLPDISTIARDTANHPDGPFNGTSMAFASEMRSYDVPPSLLQNGVSTSALDMRWTPAYPTSVPEVVADQFTTLFQNHPILFGMEVMNGTMQAREYPVDRELWDILLTRLMPERPVWGFANDDMHSMNHLGKDFTIFFLTELTENALRNAMDAGAYTFASKRVPPTGNDPNTLPPRLERVAHNALTGTLSVKATSNGLPLPESAYTWIAGGQKVHTGSTYNYRTKQGSANYVRVEMVGEGGTLCTNPFGFKRVNKTGE